MAAAERRADQTVKATVMSLRILAFLVLILAAIPKANADTVTLRLGQIPSSAHGMTSLVLFIAERKGFLARENIALDIKQIAGGTGNMIAALDRGDVDVTQTATPYLIEAVLNGSRAAAIAGEIGSPIYSMVAKPQIRTIGDLKNKLIGLSLPIDTISISTRKLLALRGLNDSDYRTKELVGSPARADCLRNGDCDAVPLGQPDDLFALKDGYHRLGDTTEAVSSFAFDVIAARRDFAEVHGPAIIGLVSALADACRFIHDPAMRDDLTKAVIDLTGASEDIARATLALYLDPDRGVVPRQAEIDLGGLDQVIAFMAQGGTIKPPLPAPERFVDLQYLRAAGVK
jgi:ABC-type nitrate/sulfonate/bicarbonate transport system substrate-binding protein